MMSARYPSAMRPRLPTVAIATSTGIAAEGIGYRYAFGLADQLNLDLGTGRHRLYVSDENTRLGGDTDVRIVDTAGIRRPGHAGTKRIEGIAFRTAAVNSS